MIKDKNVIVYHLIEIPKSFKYLNFLFAIVQNETTAITKKIINTIAKEING